MANFLSLDTCSQNWLLATIHNCVHSDKRIAKQALLQIQNYIRSSPGTEPVQKFRECGGLTRLISVLKSSEVELLDLGLSVVATCCREPLARTRVKDLLGVPILVHILKAQSVISVINRASRALANLAEDPDICTHIHNNKAIPILVKLLNDKEDSNCRQSIVRALRILADDDKHKWEITKNEGVQAMIPCIQSKADEPLVLCSIRALATITTYQHPERPDTINKFLREAARQITADPDNAKILLNLLSHSKLGIKEQALVTLFNLMPIDVFRVDVANADGIQIFVEETRDKTSATFPTFLHCLCCCCCESVNRVKVRELGGLDILLGVLKSDEEICRGQHEKALSALLNYYYDEPSLKYLASQGFIGILVSQLLSCLSDRKNTIERFDTTENRASSSKNIRTSKEDERRDSASSDVSSKRTSAICIPFPEVSTDCDYSSDLSPENTHFASEALLLPGVSTAYSPPHVDWGRFMSQRPGLVAPDVSPLSSASPRSVSPPRFSPQWSPHWSPQWSPQWSPHYSPHWEPNWSPQSSPEHSLDSFQMPEMEIVATNPNSKDKIKSAQESSLKDCEIFQNETCAKGITCTSSGSAEDTVPSTPSRSVEEHMDSSSEQSATVAAPLDESVQATCMDSSSQRTKSDKSSVSETCDNEPFRTPASSNLKFRSGKRKAKLKNTPMKTAKCLDFTPADLPLESVMSSPSHSSTYTTDEQDKPPEHKGREHDALCMLSRYSHMDNPCRDLSDCQVISGLLEYWVSSSKPHKRCWRVLTRLVENRHCFERLVLQTVPMLIYKKLYSTKRTTGAFRNKLSSDTGSERGEMVDETSKRRSKLSETSDVEMENTDSILYRLGSMAASHFGEGVMQHLLLMDDEKSQVACVLAMPYLCRSTNFLKRMFIKHGGLDKLLTYLKDAAESGSEDSMYDKAVGCLHDLANMLELHHPLLDIHRENSIDFFEQVAADLETGVLTENKKCAYNKQMTNSLEASVIFRLDDGTTIPADRQVIIGQSEYFASLLEGHYAEANQTEVPLRHITKHACLCILHHLSGCTPASCKQTKEFLEETADVAVETIARAGQFLLPRLQDVVCNIIVTNHLSPLCSVDMFELGHLHGCQTLSHLCLLYILCCYDVSGVHFGEIDNKNCGEYLYEQMRNVIVDTFQFK